MTASIGIHNAIPFQRGGIFLFIKVAYRAGVVRHVEQALRTKLPDEDPSSFCLLFSFESRVIAGVLDLGNARADVRKGNSEALVLFDNCYTVKPFNSSMWHTMTLCRTLVLRESPYQNSGGLKSTNHEAPESATTPLSTEHCCTT